MNARLQNDLLKPGDFNAAGHLDSPRSYRDIPFSQIVSGVPPSLAERHVFRFIFRSESVPVFCLPHRMAGKEECLLEQYLIIARSVTHAQRMERELRRLGIRAAVSRAPMELSGNRGCAYALAVESTDLRPVLQAIDGMPLRPVAIYIQDANGFREVAP